MSPRQAGPSRLTWHVGSVLPYASLWHTLRRAAALNTLRNLDLLNRPVMCVDEIRPARMGRIRALFNERTHGMRPALTLSSLADWLGEAHTVFRWSHFGGLPPSLRCLVNPAIRLCPACIAAGYHSALFSLVLLRRCPIHGCELVSACPTGHPLSDEIDAAALRQPALCACGRAAFFTRQTCRRPAMAAEDTRALQPVVDWLNCIASFSRPLVPDASRHAHDEHFVARTAAWCEVLEVPYPACFEKPPRLLSSIIDVSRTRSAAGAVVIDGDPGAAAAALTVAFSRHLRRHVAPRSLRAGQALMEDADPLQMAANMRADPRAMVAFAMLVFTGAVEPSVARRWPHRPTDAQETWPGRQPGAYGQSFSRNIVPPNPWLAMHAAEVEVVQRWRRAQLSTLASLRSGIADWRQFDAPAMASWIGQSVSDGQRFVSMSELGRMDWARQRLDKSQRRRRTLDAHMQRQADAAAACRDPALIWHPCDGWKVADGTLAAPTRVDRLRLLGVVGSPWIWLFQRADHFVARGRDFPVLASGDSPMAALDALRASATRYLARFPLIRLPVQPPLVAPKPVSHTIAVHRQAALSHLASYGFWRSAGLLREAVEVYLSRRQAGIRTSSSPEPGNAAAL